MEEYSFPRYLMAKGSVDDRALNSRVWQAMASILKRDFCNKPLRILEIGSGTATMLQRMFSAGLLQQVDYQAIDEQPENIAYARQNLTQWAADQNFAVEQRRDALCITTAAGWLDVKLEAVDLFTFLEQWNGKKTWDLVIANAFLDLVDIPRTLPLLRELTYPGGWFLFTINFDGLTILEPSVDPLLDEKIMSLYQQSMDERVIGSRLAGDSRAGRHLFGDLRQAGFEITEAGGSDWVVFSQDGVYPGDEAYFLRFILHFIEETLMDHSELDQDRFKDWLRQRRAQIQRGELVYIAHQLDFFACRPGR